MEVPGQEQEQAARQVVEKSVLDSKKYRSVGKVSVENVDWTERPVRSDPSRTYQQLDIRLTGGLRIRLRDFEDAESFEVLKNFRKGDSFVIGFDGVRHVTPGAYGGTTPSGGAQLGGEAGGTVEQASGQAAASTTSQYPQEAYDILADFVIDWNTFEEAPETEIEKKLKERQTRTEPRKVTPRRTTETQLRSVGTAGEGAEATDLPNLDTKLG